MNHKESEAFPEKLIAFASDTLGTGCEITVRSRAFGRQSITWRIAAGDGSNYYLKCHENRRHFETELLAYSDWVPRLKKAVNWHTPELVLSADDLGALIITEAKGEILEKSDASPGEQIEMHRIAGTLSSLIHGLDVDASLAGPPRLYDTTMFEQYIEMAAPYLDTETVNWTRQIASREGAFAGQPLVLTHSDYSPRNWLIHRSSSGISLGLIDWERARPGYWLEDMQRMAHDHWFKDPDLRVAFIDGYGRMPTEDEERQLNLICLANAIGTVPWATEHGDVAFAEFGRSVLTRLRAELR